jgi:pyruvate kinase
MTRGTKIVATIGPASTDFDILVRMIRAGVDVVRLNFSHGKAQDHIDRANLVRRAAAECGREVAIMADMQGPKIRIGKFDEGKIFLENGDSFILDAKWGENGELGNQERVGLDYKALPRDVRPGDRLLLNDGLIVLDVDRIVGHEIFTKVKVGGELSNNKGINRLGGGLTAPALTAKDMEDIKTAMSFQADYLAISFPKSATDMEMARQLANIAGEPYHHKPMMIAKIERAEAISVLQEILDASDGIMVARGDLAVEVGNAAVPALQKRMIRMARQSNKLAITATQMMESMIVNAVPTRAEVSDVANAVLDGTDAVRDRIGQVPDRNGRDDGRDLRRSRTFRIQQTRRRLPQRPVHPYRPVDRLRHAVHRAPPAREGDRRIDRVGLHRVVDEPSQYRHTDFRADSVPDDAAQGVVVS